MGTGKAAAIPGYTVAGKTGTAQKAVPGGGYSKDRYVASFIGFAPADRPRVVIAVVVDEPKGKTYGAEVAAPVFAAIGADTLRILREPSAPVGTTRPSVLTADLAEGAAAAALSARLHADDLVPASNRLERGGDAEDRVPDVSGRSARDAVRLLAARGLSAHALGNRVRRVPGAVRGSVRRAGRRLRAPARTAGRAGRHAMKLSALAADVPHRRAGPPGDPEVLAVTHDSRAAAPGTLFAALPGLKTDGRRFVADAVARGAVAALGLAPAPDATAVPYLEVENPRRSAGLMAALLAGRPSEQLVMAGVTGTSGKTTTTYLLDGLLARRHQRRGFFGTIVYRGADGNAAAIPAPHTTPEATELQPMLQALVADGGTAAIMECSSHALVLERLAGCSFDVAVFLNLSREHLDFHRDMDDYFEAKARLFSMLKPGGKAVVNLGDEYGRRLADRLPADRTVGFFLEGEEGKEQTAGAAPRGEDLFATVVGRATLGVAGTRLEISIPALFTFKENAPSPVARPKPEVTAGIQILLTIDSPLLGRSNAENLLARLPPQASRSGFRPPRSRRASRP